MNQTAKDWLQETAEELRSIGLDTTIAWQEALLLLSHVTGREKEWLVAHHEKTLLQQTRTRLKHALQRRLRHEPVAYIVGTQPFCGNDIYIDRRALIPRSETEDMTFRAMEVIQDTEGRVLVWDVGTGSGAIAVSIALIFPHIKIIASDARRSAINLAEENARASKVKNIEFTNSDLLGRNVQKILRESDASHVFVISNLPYLPKSDKKFMMKDVLSFEPWSALFAKNKGLDLNQRLLRQLSDWVNKHNEINLTLFMEFDPPQAQILEERASKLFSSAKIRVKKDSCDRDRYLELNYRPAKSR